MIADCADIPSYLQMEQICRYDNMRKPNLSADISICNISAELMGRYFYWLLSNCRPALSIRESVGLPDSTGTFYERICRSTGIFSIVTFYRSHLSLLKLGWTHHARCGWYNFWGQNMATWIRLPTFDDGRLNCRPAACGWFDLSDNGNTLTLLPLLECKSFISEYSAYRLYCPEWDHQKTDTTVYKQ